MGFKTDRMSAQDRILKQFDRVIKNDKQREKDDLKRQLEEIDVPKPPKPKVSKEDKPVYTPLYARKYKIEENKAKEDAKNKNKK
jgi:hypothetical protein